MGWRHSRVRKPKYLKLRNSVILFLEVILASYKSVFASKTPELQRLNAQLTSVLPSLKEKRKQKRDCLRPGVQNQSGQHSETSANNQKISWAWGHMPEVPGTQKAEAQQLLELRRQRVQ